MPLVSPETIEALTGECPDTNRVRVLAGLAEAAIADALPGVSFVADTETATIEADPDGRLWTPRWPVTSILATDPVIDTSDVHIRPFAGQTLPGVCAGDVVEVEYEFGWTEPPPAIALIAAQLIAAQVANPVTASGISAESFGDHSVTFAGMATPMALTRSQRRSLRRWRRTISSIAMVRQWPPRDDLNENNFA